MLGEKDEAFVLYREVEWEKDRKSPRNDDASGKEYVHVHLKLSYE